MPINVGEEIELGVGLAKLLAGLGKKLGKHSDGGKKLTAAERKELGEELIAVGQKLLEDIAD